MTKVTKQIIMVDDHRVVRQGLKYVIESEVTYEVCQEFDDGQQLIDAYPFSSRPDLIILDVSMPHLDGYQTMLELQKRGNTIPVLVLTSLTDMEQSLKLFRSGVMGYLQKDCESESLKEALKTIFLGGYHNNDHLAYSVRNNEKPKQQSEQEILISELAPREREFLKLCCHEKEYTYKEIADIMDVKHRTVDNYRESVFDKFAIKSKTGLVLFVFNRNLADLL